MSSAAVAFESTQQINQHDVSALAGVSLCVHGIIPALLCHTWAGLPCIPRGSYSLNTRLGAEGVYPSRAGITDAQNCTGKSDKNGVCFFQLGRSKVLCLTAVVTFQDLLPSPWVEKTPIPVSLFLFPRFPSISLLWTGGVGTEVHLGQGRRNSPKNLLPAAAVKKVQCGVCLYSAKELNVEFLIGWLYIFFFLI